MSTVGTATANNAPIASTRGFEVYYVLLRLQLLGRLLVNYFYITFTFVLRKNPAVLFQVYVFFSKIPFGVQAATE